MKKASKPKVEKVKKPTWKQLVEGRLTALEAKVGIAGEQGEPGKPGARGEKGDTGETGAKGDKGGGVFSGILG